MNNRRKKTLILKIILFILFLVLLAGTEVYYLRQQQFYTLHFFPWTSINGIDVGNLTEDEAQELLEKSIDPYELTLNFRDGETETLTGEEMGYVYLPTKQVQELLSAQETGKWFLHLSDSKDYTVETPTGFSYEMLGETVYALPELAADRQKEPVDASLAWNGTEFEILPEDDGYMLDADLVYQAAYEAAKRKDAVLDVTQIEGAYGKASVRSDDELLNRQAGQLAELLPKCVITYDLPTGEQVLDGSVMINWLAQDKKGNYTIDQETWDKGLDAWFASLCEKADTRGKERTFESAHAGTVTLSGTPDYGWVMEREEEKRWLEEALKNQESSVHTPAFAEQELSSMDDHSGVGGTFIEADLTAQHLWVYSEGEVILETDLVSGMMTEFSHTPDGIWLLDYKETDTTLLGDINEEGEYGYAEYVYYWMRLNDDGIGLHDATWRDAFGGDIYLSDGSHGCLNLPLDAAVQIYDFIDSWIPVVIYYSEPYELIDQ